MSKLKILNHIRLKAFYNNRKTIPLTQYEHDESGVLCNLIDSQNKTINLSDCTAANFYGDKPDGTIVGIKCIIENNSVIVPIKLQMTTAAGQLNGALELSFGNGNVRFYGLNFIVSASANMDKIESTDEFTILETTIEEAKELLKFADEKLDKPLEEGKAGQILTLDSDGSTKWTFSSGGSGGTTNYDYLINKPKINGLELQGNLTTDDLGIKDGKDGISCTHQWDGTVLTIESASGTSSADLKGETGNSGVYIDVEQPTDPDINVWINPEGEADIDFNEYAETIYVDQEIAKLREELNKPLADGSVTKEKLEENLREDIEDVINGAFPPSRNLLKLPNYSINAEDNHGVGVNIKDGLFTIKGTATQDIKLIIPIEAFNLSIDTYTYAVKNINSKLPTGSTVYIKTDNYANVSNVYAVLNSSYSKKTFTLTSAKNIGFISVTVAAGVEVDQTFNLQLEVGEISTSYVPADDKTFGGDTTRIVEKLDSNVVLASTFYAVGDGVTDDTEALQRAINYCSENYKMLKLDSGKSYLISAPLVWNENSVYFDGNFATLTASKNIGSLINLDCTDINDATTTKDWGSRNYRQQVVKNLVLNCNGVVDCGLRIEKGIKTHCSDLTINDPVTYGVFINQNGWENFISNVHITRLLDSTGGNGLFVYGSDNSFDNIVVIGCQTGVVNIGADNHYSRVHPWSTTEALENLRQSISFDCRWSYCTFSQCIGDSTNIIFKISNNARVMISNCVNAWSDGYIENRLENSNPHLFYFDETHERKGSDVTISGCYFKPKVTEIDETFKCYYSNLTEEDNPMLIDRATSGWENQPSTTESILKDTGVAINTALGEILALQKSYIEGGESE